ncbi:MAG: hypothetical protein KC668_10115, partial [Myxococcales bacterium]|nr:hypothetical protein [Myxococcales bacterium]
TSRRTGRWRRLLRGAAPGLLVLLVTTRVVAFGGNHATELVVLNRSGHVVSTARFVNRLFEERDAALVGSRLLVALGAVPAPEFPTLPELLRRSYPATEQEGARLGTPRPDDAARRAGA